jgi:hypothetical protein
MIVITFSLQNPYFKGWRDFKNIRNWHGATPFKNKFWEVELLKSGEIVMFDLTVRTRCDHAGTTLGLGLLGYTINITLYDNRHWDVENNCWKVYGQSV